MNRDMGMFRNATPGVQPRPQKMSDGEYVNYLEDRALAQGPLKVQSLEEPFLLEKTAQCGRRLDESLVAFIGRVQLGPRPLREWTVERISSWVAVKESQADDLAPEPRMKNYSDLVAPDSGDTALELNFNI